MRHDAPDPNATWRSEPEVPRDIHEYLAQHQRKDLLRFLTCGNVDDGKSTLIGRLLHDTRAVYEDQLNALRVDTARYGTTGTEIDFALLVDGLQAEREQGITIDVAYRYFSTARRKFIIADCPGHEQYTRNMVTGASTCDLAIILIDARNGVRTQTRRHSYLVSLLGLRHVVVAVNKMDLVGWSQQVFENIRADYLAFAARLDLPDIRFVPLSALRGDNVVYPSRNMPWYAGGTLIEILENVPVVSDPNLDDLRFPVQFVNRPNPEFRGYCGTIASGVLRRGDEIMVLPSRMVNRVKSIITFDGELEEARAGQAVTLTLEKEVDISRGDLIVHPHSRPVVDEQFEAVLVWMSDTPLKPNRHYLMKHTTRTLTGWVSQIRYKVNVNTLQHEPADQLQLNEIAHVLVNVFEPIPFDPYRKNRTMGAFIVIDRLSNNTVGAGMILERGAGAQPSVPESIRRYAERHRSLVTPEERAQRLGQRPVTVWLNGLYGSGKRALAYALERRLFDLGRCVRVLEGGNARLGAELDVDFHHDRADSLRRAAEVARLFNETGVICICAFVVPTPEDRGIVRQILRGRLIEVYLSAPLEICRQRDPVGLYASADAGLIRHFPGVTTPFVAPESPDLVLPSHELPTELCVERVVMLLRQRGLL